MSPAAIALILISVAGCHGRSVENCDKNSSESMETIDQRQNGTENVRVNVKDVVLVWAPSDALLEAGGYLDSDLLDYPNEEVPQKPLGSNEIEKPTSIFDILVANFPQLSNATGKDCKAITLLEALTIKIVI